MSRLLAIIGLVLASNTFAAPLFDTDEPLALTLNAPFALIDLERDKEKEYPGSLSYNDSQQGRITLDAKFSVRGHFRLRRDICGHAQLWINLKKSQLKGTLFAKQDKLKLVVQCKDSRLYADYIGREYKAYRIFQVLSELSLSTRMLAVTYADSDGGNSREQAGFFIQHQDRLAKQNDMTVYREPSADKARLNPERSALVALFMYLIANTDYSFVKTAPGESCCHNVKLLESADGSLYPLPYDYDSTGFVNTSYAEPTSDIGQKDIKQRMYRGYCVAQDVLANTVSKFQSQRESIYAIVNDKTHVSARSIRHTRKFIDEFFDMLDDPDAMQRQIIEICR